MLYFILQCLFYTDNFGEEVENIGMFQEAVGEVGGISNFILGFCSCFTEYKRIFICIHMYINVYVRIYVYT